MLFSISLNLKYGLSARYDTKYFVVGGVSIRYKRCQNSMNDKEKFVEATITITLGIWLPMLLIAIVYILMYLGLKKQATIRRQNSSLDSQAQMNRISRTFTVILLVFYICYLPNTIQFVVNLYTIYNKKPIYLDAVADVSTFLQFSNSCLNPIIYSNIHQKIFICIRQFIEACRKKCYCVSQLTCCNEQSTTPQPTTQNNENNQNVPDHIAAYHGPEDINLQVFDGEFIG